MIGLKIDFDFVMFVRNDKDDGMLLKRPVVAYCVALETAKVKAASAKQDWKSV